MNAELKAQLKRFVPPEVLNAVLLHFPALYATSLVAYESNFQDSRVREELLGELARTLNIPGDIIECGSSRCGTSAIMALLLRSRNIKKTIYACDSFEGFDRNELSKEYAAGLTTTPSEAFTSTSYSYVCRKLSALRLQDYVIPVKGYFQQTLPNMTGPFCFALIDCDLKESLLYAAETIWPRLTSGGVLLFDDYLEDEFKGARLGVEEFLHRYRGELGSSGLLEHFYFVRKP